LGIALYLSIENVRCFSVKQRVEIRPLTILVGENSSGKSTFLSILHAAVQAEFPNIPKIFNQSPFEMGGFDTIATYKGGKYGRAESFLVGFEWEKTRNKVPSSHSVQVKFENNRGMPVVREITVKMNDVTVKANPDGTEVHLQLIKHVHDGAQRKFSTRFPYKGTFSSDLLIPFYIRRAIVDFEHSEFDSEFKEQAQEAVRFAFQEKIRSLSMAPLRTEPKRTYDESSDLDFNPGGDHIPRVLSQLDFEDNAKKEAVFSTLNEFGRSAGLFESIKVKHLGKRPSDPFQVSVVTQGPAANLVDVGYGVSQALPILVEVLSGSKSQQFILQQPEVHLHPRAQAALGAFFVNAVSSLRKRFVIETHSDFLIDRIRYEVAKGKLKPEDVRILFFDRPHFDVTISEISLDAEGNLKNAPPSYRKFFLEEEMRLMTRGA
jgi:hypothetical protein